MDQREKLERKDLLVTMGKMVLLVQLDPKELKALQPKAILVHKVLLARRVLLVLLGKVLLEIQV
jgi:hypothetical protein